MEVGELDLNRGRHQVGGRLDDHCHHLGVEEGGVAAERRKGTHSQFCS